MRARAHKSVLLLSATVALLALCVSPNRVEAQIDFNAVASNEILTNSTVIFGGSGSYPPFHFFNAQGVADGFDVSVFNRIAEINGWQTGYRLGAWDQIQQALGNGEVDMVPMFVSAERESRYLFSNAMHVEYHLLFGPATSAAYASLSALGTERIAAEGGAYATSELLKINPNVTIVNAESEADALTLVDRGEADLALLPSEIGRYNLRTRNLSHLAALSSPLLPVTYAFAINPLRPDLLVAANAGIEQLQRQGELETLRNRWLYLPPENLQSDNALDRALVIASWSLLMLLLLVAVALLSLRYYRLQPEHVQSRFMERVRQFSHTEPDINRPAGGLAGRQQLMEQLESEIKLAKKDHGQRALALITVLNLNALQDAFDEMAGDELLEQIALLIPQNWINYCGQVSTGVFGFVFKNADSCEQDLAELLIQCSQSVMIRDLSIHPQLCAGLALYPDHASSATNLLHRAKLAMNQARRSGSTLLVFSPEMRPDPRRIQIISDLRHALAQHELRWAIQPQFKVCEQRVYGAELLIRWQHHKHGWMSPAEFIPWAEESGLITQVSNQVIDQTAILLDRLSEQNAPFHLSINLSSNDLCDDMLVESMIERFRDKASHLTVEVTETALMRNKEAALRNINKLKLASFRVALDDFGTGYASMEYLQAFLFDEIKIDRCFINNMSHIERNRKLTKASIELGHQLNAFVVAEGVEDTDTANILVDMGCDVLQGYLIGRPELLGDVSDIRQSWKQIAL